MKQPISSKNTKNQIIDAYEALLKQVEEKKTEEPKKVQEQQQKLELTQKAKTLSDQGIVKDIAELKVSVSSVLDKLGVKITDEYNKFEELQKAIAIEKQNLQDLYSLSANTDSLAVMLLAQKEQKEKFEQEMNTKKTELDVHIKSESEKFDILMIDKRTLWKKEQEEHTLQTKETIELLKKNRTREEEEYIYNLKIDRKKEVDTYNEKLQKQEKDLKEKKTAFEKEFTERRVEIEAAEAELKALREENTTFPAKQEKAITNAVTDAITKIKTQHQFETELKAKGVEGELNLKDQTISALNTKIKEMDASMKEMSQKTSKAETSVKDIALKAIESSSAKPYVVERNNDIKTD